MTGYGVRQKRWCKLSFEIGVAEITGGDTVEAGVGASQDMKGVSVTLDPAEHQAYAWATEEEIKEGKYAITTANGKNLMLEAFALKQADVKNSEALLATATSAGPGKIGSSE